MLKQKSRYIVPLVKFLEVGFEESIMSPTDYQTNGGGGSYGTDDTNENGDF